MGTTSYVSTTTVECEICGHEQRIKSYHEYVCERCGQPYIYDNDCYRIELSPSQLELLRKQQLKTDPVMDQIEIIARFLEDLVLADGAEGREFPSLQRLPKSDKSWIGWKHDAGKLSRLLTKHD